MNRYKSKIIPDKAKFSTKNVVTRELGTKNIILDIGCNDGYFGKFDKNNTYYGIDYSKEAIRKTKYTYKDALVYDLNKLQKLPWDIKYDVIIFADVLEHLTYPDKVLNFFCKNYLKKGGKVVVSLPNIANWQIRLNLLLGDFNYTNTGIMDKTHLHFYTFNSALSLVRESKLKIYKIHYGASFFGPIISVMPFLKSLLATNIIITAKK